MLPISRVVLFKHGVGYFERTGPITGDASVELAFRASEMNDVLKSLTVLDHDGGLVASISYESTQPLSKQLEDFAIQVPPGQAITGLLAQLTGTRVALELAGRKVDGVLAGIEPSTRVIGDEAIASHRLGLWVDGVALESVDVLDVRRIELADPQLRRDLQHLLDILISAKKKDLKRLTIYSRGAGERALTVSYVIETPVWKTSYRALLYGGETTIQGWALVDNTQDEDWTDVALTLVAGLPISFVHDLYSPRYKRRPVVVVEEEAAYAPPVLEQGIPEPAPKMAKRAAPAPAARPGAPPPPAAAAPSRPPPPPPQAHVATRTQEVGDLLHYTIDNPVTVRRNQSALVPILQRAFAGKRIAIYNPEIRAKNPMSALLFKNTTGLTLEGGPMTVIEDGSYLGEAMLDPIKPDEERVIPFSVELGCVVQIDHRSDQLQVHRARLVNGQLRLHRYRLLRRIYVLHNKTDRPFDLFLDHRFRPGYELAGGARPVERTDSFYRFRFDVPAHDTVRFEVAEKGEEVEVTAISSASADDYGVWLRDGYVDAATHRALEAIAALALALATTQRQIDAHDLQLRQLIDDQERLRKNLQALGGSEDERRLRERYVAALGDAEDQLIALRGELQALRDEHARRGAELRGAIAAIDVDLTTAGA